MSVDLSSVGQMNGPYDDPLERSYELVVIGWEAGFEWQNRFCESNQKYYFCRYSCILIPVPF